jgi:acyl carrier protein
MHLIKMIRQGYLAPYPYMEELLAEVGVDTDTDQKAGEDKLQPKGREFLAWQYGQLARRCREEGILPVFVLLPQIEEQKFLPELIERQARMARRQVRLAEDAGFVTIDLTGLWDGQDVENLWVAEYDKHPNEPGHELICDRLHTAILAHPEVSEALGLFPLPRPRQASEIKQAVKEFLLEEFLQGEDPEALTEDTPLITGGILDSIATLKLVSFLEERYAIELAAHEADPEHLDTLEDIGKLVLSKKG